ncbi:MAG: TIGR02281 family clan AA aspartic protease [Hyphomicrobiales bacterium]
MRSSHLLLLLLGLLALTLVILLVLPEGSTVLGLEDEQFANISYLTILGLLIASGFTLRGLKFSKVLRDIGIWLLAGLLLIGGYTFKDDLKPIWQRITASLNPGQPISLDDNRVQIARGKSGDFIVKAMVNAQDINFLFDTGANAVVLTYDDAIRAGFTPDRLNFSVSVDTANGRTTAAPIRIGSIQIGSIVRKNIRGLIANKQDLKSSLLGMTFMNELTGFSVTGDTLEFRD